MTIQQNLELAVNRLDVKSAELDAEVLLMHVLNRDRAWLYSHKNDTLSPIKSYKYRRYIKRRAKGEPVAYIINNKEFYGLDFYVSKNVLIPRPETELLVEEVIRILKDNSIAIDIGTGSGCIPIALAKNTNKNIDFFGTDISKKALGVAVKNAKKHEVKVGFLQGDLLEPILKKGILKNKGLVITANLPYLSDEMYEENHINLKHEPKQALVAKKNGLALYEKLLKQIKKINLPMTIFLEIDPRQAKLIEGIIGRYLPEAKIQIKKDLAKLDRLVIINLQ